MDSQRKYPAQFSFEFFPPKGEKGVAKLDAVRSELALLNPRYVSVTYGAGGNTQDGTLDAVRSMLAAGLDTAPHLSCIDSSREHLRELLQLYIDMGVRRVVALRGDLPSGMGDTGDLHYANELVDFIRAETGDHFHIEVAAYPEFHPQAKSATHDLDNFKRKVEAGADSAITQYFFNADAYFRFVDDCERRGLSLPIVPGIMPITNYTQLARFSGMCGAEIPRWLEHRLQAYGDDLASIRALGHEVVVDMCRRLLDQGAPGLHFYSMNQSGPTTALWRDLGLS